MIDRRTLGCACFAVAWSIACDASASPQDIIGFGARASAVGATGAAWAVGHEATWGNPALLSLGRVREVTLGVQAVRPTLRAEGPSMPGDVGAEGVAGTVIGASLPLPLGGALRDRVALGLGFFTPFDVVVRGRVLYPERPQFALITDRLKSVAIQAGAGVDLGRGVRVGAGFSALAAIEGTVVVATDASGSVGTKVDDQLVASYAPIVGASVDVARGYRVGAVARGSIEARFGVVIEVRDLGSLTVPPLNIAGLAQYDPSQAALEVARVEGRVRASVGATYKRWSRYPGAQEPTVVCPPERPACLAPRPEAPGFHDTVTLRAGVEVDAVEGTSARVAARAGYFFEPTPAPEQVGAANGFDADRHAVTLGAGVDLADEVFPARLDVFGQVHRLSPRTHAKSAPDAGGAPVVVTTTGHVVAGGVAATLRF